MERKEYISSHYMQRGAPEFRGQQPFHQLANVNPSMSFQSNVGDGSSSQALMVEPSSVVSPDGINLGTPSVQPSSTPLRRKRGRPRKYGSEGGMSLALSPSSSNARAQGMIMSANTNLSTQKRGRGRPPGTGKKQQLSSLSGWLQSGSAGAGFTPHVINIAAGEDISANIMSFAQRGQRAVCILSASGVVSTVTLHQPSTSSGAVTYEGRFDILCMSGSFLHIANDGSRNQSGGLSISLASPDGRVIGGGVSGMLIAASSVQVILGSFIWGSSKTKQKTGERTEVGGDLEHHAADSAISTRSVQPGQTPAGSMGAWHSTQAADMENSHFSIDLMHG